jgi:hypothetical protein
MADEKKFTHVGVEVQTQKKISILAKVEGENIYDLVALWAEEAWEKARKAGRVTDAMLHPTRRKVHFLGKENIVEIDDEEHGEKLLKAVVNP